MSDPEVATTGEFKPYVNTTTGSVILALELTASLIEIMKHTVGLEEQAVKAEPGDFAIGFEVQIMPGKEFHEEYKLVEQDQR